MSELITYAVRSSATGLLVAEPVLGEKYLAGHIHTSLVDGQMRPEEAVDRAVELGAHAVAITDHDDVSGSVVAQNYASNRGLDIEVIPGTEVSTHGGGHILAIGVDRDISSYQSPGETNRAIHEAGGVAILAHPGLAHARSIDFHTALGLIKSEDPSARPDGIEVFNGSGELFHAAPVTRPLFRMDSNARASAFHAMTPDSGAAFGGADAHGRHIGVFTSYQGKPLDALRAGATDVVYNATDFNLVHSAVETVFMAGVRARNKVRGYIGR